MQDEPNPNRHIQPKYSQSESYSISNLTYAGKNAFFHKSYYRDAEVFDVVENAYILVCHQQEIFAIDQHAASEKILYMDSVNHLSQIKKFKRVESVNGKSKVFQIPNLYKTTIEDDAAQMNKYGWFYKVIGFNGSFTQIQIQVEPEVHNTRLTEQDFLHYLNEIYENNIYGKTQPSQNEKQIMAEYACHNALRFGDSISLKEATQLVRKLAEIQAPFTCPHSRISVISLGNINQYKGNQNEH